MNLMQRARGKMMIKHPFFATLMVTTPWVETRDLPTAGTDMEKIYFNPDFMESLGTVEKAMFVIAHEVMHIAFNHGQRLHTRNPMIWNIACDFAINLILAESGFELPDCALYDKKWEGKSADDIYEELMKLVDKARQKGQSGEPGQGNIPGFDDMHGGKGDLMQPAHADNPAKAAELERSIKQRVAQAATTARMAGKVSAGLDRFINDVLDPKVPWPDLLRDYMTRVTKDDESWGRRNRRFRDIYLPARHSEKMGEIIVIGDTSGSIGPEELQQVATEVQAVADQVKPERIRVMWADTRVCGEQVFEEGELILVKPKGGGGTDMRVPLREAEKYEPHVVILITDGYTPWPEGEPPYPLIVCCTTEVEPPVGSLVKI